MAGQSKLARKTKDGDEAPPIPLERPKPKKVAKSDLKKYILRQVANDNTSPTHEVSIAIFSDGKPEEWLKFRRTLEEVFKGQGITTGPARFSLVKTLLNGTAATSFNNEFQELAAGETVASCNACLDAVARDLFPTDAVSRERDFLMKNIRKPVDMKVRKFVGRVEEINNYLDDFPPDEDDDEDNPSPAKLTRPELMGGLHKALPVPWKQEIKEHAFRPKQSTPAEFVKFCERFEDESASEKKAPLTNVSNNDSSDESGTPVGNKRKRRGGGNKKGKKGKGGKNKEETFCLIHGRNKTHASDDCFALQKLAKRARALDQTDSNDKRRKKSKKSFSTQEVNTLLSVVDEMRREKKKKDNKKPKRSSRSRRKELNAFARVSNKASADSDDDESECVYPG